MSEICPDCGEVIDDDMTICECGYRLDHQFDPRIVIENYKCMKCGNDDYQVDKFCATGTGLTKIYDLQTKYFTVVSCTKCGFSELYKGDTKKLANVLDFLIGS